MRTNRVRVGNSPDVSEAEDKEYGPTVISDLLRQGNTY